MREKYRAVMAVWLVLVREGKILLQLRQNTGYMDGKWDMAASGHLEADEKLEEGIIREAAEEIGVRVKKKSLKLITVEYDDGDGYMRFFFACDAFEGKPRVMEPEKCVQLKWFSMKALPVNLIPAVGRAIERIQNGVFYDIK